MYFMRSLLNGPQSYGKHQEFADGDHNNDDEKQDVLKEIDTIIKKGTEVMRFENVWEGGEMGGLMQVSQKKQSLSFNRNRAEKLQKSVFLCSSILFYVVSGFCFCNCYCMAAKNMVTNL